MSIAIDGGDTGSAAGYGALSASSAVAGSSALWAASWLELTGADRARFLHGLVTCDVKALEPGQGAYGFFVDAKGRILADMVVSALADRLLLELPGGKAPEIKTHLERFVVADRVEIAELGGERSIVAGPEARRVLRALVSAGKPAPKGWEGHPLELAGGETLLLRGERRLGVEAWVARSSTAAGASAFCAALRKLGAVAAGAQDLETIRIERGMPRAGVDFGPDHFPQETGLEELAVSYTKGCYLGQEVVARIHYRGKVNHALCGLSAEAGAEIAVGSRLADEDGNDAGRVTSAARSPALGRWVGLSILHRRFADEGRRLQLASGSTVEVAKLPFVAPPPVDGSV